MYPSTVGAREILQLLAIKEAITKGFGLITSF